MITILHNPDTLLHAATELQASKIRPAFECPARLTSILGALNKKSISFTSVPLDEAAAQAAARRIHSEPYLNHLKGIYDLWAKQGLIEHGDSVLPECFPVDRLAGRDPKKPPPVDIYARVGFYAFDMSTGVMEHTYKSAIASADLARRGAETLAEKPEHTVFVLTRPPGHHCSKDLMGGYCYMNNVAIAVETLIEKTNSEDQVTILDLDFHHGNGTQDIFYKRRNPAYISIHCEDEYPYYSGYPDEVGVEEGEGYNMNILLPAMTRGDGYLAAVRKAIEKVQEVGTKRLVVSLGFDTFGSDPIGKFALETANYAAISKQIGALGLPTLLVLEGGYCVEKLGDNVVSFLEGFEEGRNATKL
jgi:acetoin utilization deacetylase AcuC-like enzyme